MIKEELIQEQSKVNRILEKYLPRDTEYGRICEAMEYSVLNGGKRLRAIMLLKAFEMFCSDKKAEEELAEPFAAALECIHAYSLVHDDLPAMDNDVLRRGKPTTHVAFGHAMGVLAGDALLNYAYEIISDIITKIDSTYDSDKINLYSRNVLKAFKIIASKPGYSGMIGGQVLDTCVDYTKDADYREMFPEADAFIENTVADINRVKFFLRIYELKTSQLIEIALMCGAILGNADDKCVKLMEKAGRSLGLAFQIEDDILDMTSNAETLGKSVNIDERNNKTTVARQLGIENAIRLVEYYTTDAIDCLKETGCECGFLTELFKSLIFRKL